MIDDLYFHFPHKIIFSCCIIIHEVIRRTNIYRNKSPFTPISIELGFIWGGGGAYLSIFFVYHSFRSSSKVEKIKLLDEATLVMNSVFGILSGVSMNSPSLNTLTSYRVDEGQTISLKCSVFVTASELITWYWTCGDDDLTRNSTSNGKITTLTFKADRKFNGKYCYCTAKSTSLNQTNEVKSRFQSIQVYCEFIIPIHCKKNNNNNKQLNLIVFPIDYQNVTFNNTLMLV